VAVSGRIAYYTALARAAPSQALVGAAARKLARALSHRLHPPAPTPASVLAQAARALAGAPIVLDRADAPRVAILRAEFPGEIDRILAAADAAARGQVQVFGRAAALDQLYLDPLSGRPCPRDGAEDVRGSDPKGPWEVGRFAHALGMAQAARLDAARGPTMRRALCEQVAALRRPSQTPGDLHASSPLELSLRALHVLCAVDLLGGGDAFRRPESALLAEFLLRHGQTIARNLEDTGVVSGSHLLSNLAALAWLGLALDRADWRRLAERRLPRAASGQVYSDGAGFEGSTAYHRFSLEILLAAAIAARTGHVRLRMGFWECLWGMFRFATRTLAPDGTDPGFGDSDDGRVLPFCQRAPRDQSYLPPLGAVLFADATLKPKSGKFAPEPLWLLGAQSYPLWQGLPAQADTAGVSARWGGVHILRAKEGYVALRCGTYGQRGVGGHAHNDQLSLCAWLGARPLVIDPGTGSYADALCRDRFRSTSAHATVTVDGEEQSPLYQRRFALPDRARAHLQALAPGTVVAEHQGYRRLPGRVLHRREITLHSSGRGLRICDRLLGRGNHAVAITFPFASELEVRRGLSPAASERLAALFPGAGELDRAGALELSAKTRPVAALCQVGGQRLAVGLYPAWISAAYGRTESAVVARFFGQVDLPWTWELLMIELGGVEAP
jgi:hypothetical protein